jgi:hypothetical protein
MLGRPKVLDTVKQASICALLNAGCSRRQAAKYVGCAPSTIGYLAANDPHFAAQVRQAEMQKEVRPLRNLMQASGKHWRAAAWLLERQFPNLYARRQPDLMTRHEFREAISSLTNALIDAVPVAADRRAVRNRIGQVLDGLDAGEERPHDSDEEHTRLAQPARRSRQSQRRRKPKAGSGGKQKSCKQADSRDTGKPRRLRSARRTARRSASTAVQ